MSLRSRRPGRSRPKKSFQLDPPLARRDLHTEEERLALLRADPLYQQLLRQHATALIPDGEGAPETGTRSGSAPAAPAQVVRTDDETGEADQEGDESAAASRSKKRTHPLLLEAARVSIGIVLAPIGTLFGNALNAGWQQATHRDTPVVVSYDDPHSDDSFRILLTSDWGGREDWAKGGGRQLADELVRKVLARQGYTLHDLPAHARLNLLQVIVNTYTPARVQAMLVDQSPDTLDALEQLFGVVRLSIGEQERSFQTRIRIAEEYLRLTNKPVPAPEPGQTLAERARQLELASIKNEAEPEPRP